MLKRILLPLMMVFLATSAFAQDKARQLGDTIAPFVDEQTVAVGCADLSAIDPDAARKWLVDTARKLNAADARADAPEMVRAAKWLADFRKAGGKHIFTVIDPADLPYVPLIVPLEEGADAKAIGALLISGSENGPVMQAQMRNAVVLGSPAVLERLRQIKPAVRPELAMAFAAAGDVPVRAAIIPGNDIRRIIAELMPKLPDQVGGGSTEPLSKGLSWAAGGATFPPAPTAHIVVQCQDAASAKALSDLIGSVYAAARRSADFNETKIADQFLAAMTPTVNNDRLVLDLNADNLLAVLAPQLAAARERAYRARSANNLKSMGMSCYIYADADKEKQFPPDLGTLLTKSQLNVAVSVSPSSGKTIPTEIRSASPAEQAKWINANSDYVYLGAGMRMNTPQLVDKIMAYEKPEINQNKGMNVLYGDGHVEWVADVAATMKKIEQQRGK